MTHSTSSTAFDATALPPVVARYLAAQDDAGTRPAIIDLFAPDARVVDEGIERVGSDAIRDWLATTASAFEYTTTFVDQRNDGGGAWVVRARLEGNFPGGVADLRYSFSVADDHIVDLMIAP